MAEQQIPGIVRVPVLFANAYLIDVVPEVPQEGWVLLDTGLGGIGHEEIYWMAKKRYDILAPRSIVLTHGHFDHAGSADTLTRQYGSRVYAHRLEMPYLTGQSSYPPPDPTVGGALAQLSRAFPYGPYQMGEHIHPLPDDGSVPGLPGWRVIHTPGHTAGHISLVRDSDRLVLAGDALATMNQDSWTTLVTMPRELRWPPAALTTDWSAARTSLHRLAELRPSAIAAGHGLPMSGPDVAEQLERFASHFMPPRDGRYVRQPVVANESGVVSLPLPVPDPVGTAILAATATAATAGFVIALARSRRRA